MRRVTKRIGRHTRATEVEGSQSGQSPATTTPASEPNMRPYARLATMLAAAATLATVAAACSNPTAPSAAQASSVHPQSAVTCNGGGVMAGSGC